MKDSNLESLAEFDEFDFDMFIERYPTDKENGKVRCPVVEKENPKCPSARQIANIRKTRPTPARKEGIRTRLYRNESKIGDAISFLALMFLGMAWGCSSNDKSQPTSQGNQNSRVSVAAASDLTYALPAITEQFQKIHPELQVVTTFGSSGSLFSQITQGAPFDLFLSADASYPARLVEQGVAVEDSTFPYGVGHLVIWVPEDSSLDFKTDGLQLLSSPSIRKIAIANPKHAPYGRAAESALRRSKVYEQIETKLVLGENVAQALQFVSSGSADVGIIALSLALAQKKQGKGRYWQVDEALHEPLIQKGILLKQNSNQQGTESFRDFLLSPQGQGILLQFGIAPPRNE